MSEPLHPHAPVPVPADDVDGTQPGPSLRDAWTARAPGLVDRGSRATGLDPATFVPMTAGAGALVLLLLLTMVAWWTYRVDMTVMGTPLSEAEWYRGIAYAEGKAAFIGVLAAGVWIGLGLFKSSWLPAGLLFGGGVGTFCAVAMLGLRSRLATAYENVLQEMRATEGFMNQNPLAGAGAEALRETGTSLVPTFSGGPSWALAFGILVAIGAAVAFLVACLRDPPTLPLFQKPGAPAIVQRYGLVGASFGLAFLLGLAFAVIRY